MADEPETSDAKQAASGCGIVLIGVLVLSVIFGLSAKSCGGSSSTDASDQRFSAFYACESFVKRQLKSQSTAEFPDPTEDDGEVTFSHSGKRWTIVSQVDAENSFGAKLTLPFTCEILDRGDRWENLNTIIDE